MKLKNYSLNKKKYDIVIIGAGPAGIAFALGFANTKLKIAIIDKVTKSVVSKPKIDGREVAITHSSEKILKNLNVWNLFPKKLVSIIKEAKVLDGDSSYFLNFNHEEIKKKNLGYLIPNHIIKKTLYKRLKKVSNVTLINKTECFSISPNKEYSTVVLSNGKTIKAALVVAADGRFSKMRSKMGLSAYIRNFNKDMIVCRMKHEKSHQNTAYEFFRYNQTQAILPYIKNHSSIVTTSSKDNTSTFMKMNKKDFNREMESSFNNFLGKMSLVGKRYSYPMVTTYTKKFTTDRFALIGDAAVGMHPVTAHGFNLGLKGLDILIDEIKSAIKSKSNIGSAKVLKNYQTKMNRAAAPIYLTTNSIVNLYTSNILPAKVTRQFFLRLVNTIEPIKRTFLNILR
jgi:ubiquinone biosynthesis UbiH/UbiF/VisC/COQ6 family hydroxylase